MYTRLFLHAPGGCVCQTYPSSSAAIESKRRTLLRWRRWALLLQSGGNLVVGRRVTTNRFSNMETGRTSFGPNTRSAIAPLSIAKKPLCSPVLKPVHHCRDTFKTIREHGRTVAYNKMTCLGSDSVHSDNETEIHCSHNDKMELYTPIHSVRSAGNYPPPPFV